MHQAWHCIIADFKQRTRQQSFVVTLMAMSVLTLLFFPAPDALYQTLVINDYRGIYNSAWLGVCLAMLNVLFLPIIGFYLVKNALELDRQSMMGEIIATTSIGNFTFLLAKWGTNVLILVSIVLVMLLSSMLIQLYYGESYQLDLWALIWPQLVFVFPLLLAIAAIAIMFESSKWLKGGLGNVVYFFLWIGSIVQTIESISGVGALLDDLEKEVTARFPLQQGSTNIGVTINNDANLVNTFVWQGTEPTLTHFWGMIPLLVVCVICLALAFIFFDRFKHNQPAENRQFSWLNNILMKCGQLLDHVFIAITRYFAFTRLLRLELKLMLKGQSIYWFLGLIILNIIQIFSSHQLVVGVFLPLSWLWCVLVISPLGQLEKQANTFELMTYSKQSPILQNLASYSAAWILLLLASIGSVLRFAVVGEWILLIQLLIAVSFTVSLAYFCGAFTGTKRMFEGLYLALWYMGPIQTALYFDFFGVNSQASWQAGMPYYFFTIAVALLLITFSAKKTR